MGILERPGGGNFLGRRGAHNRLESICPFETRRERRTQGNTQERRLEVGLLENAKKSVQMLFFDCRAISSLGDLSSTIHRRPPEILARKRRMEPPSKSAPRLVAEGFSARSLSCLYRGDTGFHCKLLSHPSATLYRRACSWKSRSLLPAAESTGAEQLRAVSASGPSSHL